MSISLHSPFAAMTERAHGDRASGYDVAVVGGGMAGCVAAIAAARAGSKVLIIEQNAFFGGAATAGVVGQFVGWSTRSGRKVIAGLAEEIVDRLQSIGGCGRIEDFTMSTGHSMNRVQFDPELLKITLDEIVTEAGVDVLFKSVLTGCETADGAVQSIVVWSAGKILSIRATAFVDASGDMALLKSSGAAFLELGEGEALQPATMMFAMAPIDFEKLDAVSEKERKLIVKRGLDGGALPRAALHYSRAPGTNEAWFNISRVNVEPDDPFSLSNGEIEGRSQVMRIASFLKANLPGCANARLSSMAPQLGIRDTRRVEGDYVITADDLRQARDFPDVVACGAYPIDIHHAGSPDLTFEEFGPDHHYRIPFRALLPANLANVAAAGRGISADHDAFAALRVMPTAMAVGEAAGTAAAMASTRTQGVIRAIDVGELQETLHRQGAYLGT
ncbi:FAD-dependent oxidoreductase [Mesorhizobium sp. L-8-3]|uniref:FAD-dependent oxidoreductase n=1 Tax=Mesorhizobium sp. L-8-3 TaxID=2744522 RepID=UPI001927EA6E|nr:FAD-dependent oxidoreductase [Mesorhizobium sp. L-8-3]BCH23367.1 membrane protein [Mesorhizobium sp. L-8-3]